MSEKVEKVQKDLTEALKIAKSAWEEAGMPKIYEGPSDENGKIALAILAKEVMKRLE